MLNKTAGYCSRRAKLIFSARIQIIWLRLKISGAELTVSTHGEIVNALDGRILQNAVIRTPSALNTLVRVDLPYHTPRPRAAGKQSHRAAQAKQARAANAAPDKFPSGYNVLVFRHLIPPFPV